MRGSWYGLAGVFLCAEVALGLHFCGGCFECVDVSMSGEVLFFFLKILCGRLGKCGAPKCSSDAS